MSNSAVDPAVDLFLSTIDPTYAAAKAQEAKRLKDAAQKERRERIATAIVGHMYQDADPGLPYPVMAQNAVSLADALIAELDKERG